MAQDESYELLVSVAEDATKPAAERLAAWDDVWGWLLLSNQLERALALAGTMRDVAEESGDLAAAVMADVVAADVIALLPGPKAEAMRLADEGMIEAQGFGLPHIAARAQVVLGYAFGTVGSFHSGIEHLLSAKQSLRELGDKRMLAWADLRLARVLFWAEEPEGAARTSERVIRWSRSEGETALLCGALVELGESFNVMGRSVEARHSVEEALLLAQRHGYGLFEGEALVCLGDCLRAEGRPPEALACYTEALDLFGHFPSLLFRLGSVHHALGEVDTARAELDRAVALSVAEGYADIEFRARDLLASIEEESGDLPAALEQTRLARDAERGHRTSTFDRRVSELLAGFEVQRMAREAATERDRRAELELQALTDPLTGLLNRRGFDAAVSGVGADTYSLLMLDLNKFKPINDQYGHPVGDEVLKRAGQALVASCPESALIARVGGDEFAVVLPGAEAEQARGVAEDIVQALAAIDLADLAPGHAVGVSVGCSHRRTDDDDVATLMQLADRALYRAKSEGYGRFCSDHLDV
ncbi:MAG: diguanylate cyclase [Actinobacteria bacterium]|uniref:Unannotated protein n=1 Tax=freshwater metagenome TaxID=449393 RepID=A0A6J7K9G0_9ZZZZ|nr:diguanylate cyclase [Actinomycetota bacterium]